MPLDTIVSSENHIIIPRIIYSERNPNNTDNYSNGHIEGNLWFNLNDKKLFICQHANNGIWLSINVGNSLEEALNGDIVINGNLTVKGDTSLFDAFITLNPHYSGSNPVSDCGLIVNRGTLPKPSIYWDESEDKWKVFDGNNTYPLFLDSFEDIIIKDNDPTITFIDENFTNIAGHKWDIQVNEGSFKILFYSQSSTATSIYGNSTYGNTNYDQTGINSNTVTYDSNFKYDNDLNYFENSSQNSILVYDGSATYDSIATYDQVTNNSENSSSNNINTIVPFSISHENKVNIYDLYTESFTIESQSPTIIFNDIENNNNNNEKWAIHVNNGNLQISLDRDKNSNLFDTEDLPHPLLIDSTGKVFIHDLQVNHSFSNNADLAEKYTCKTSGLPIGTVLSINPNVIEDCDITKNEVCENVIGVISENPAYVLSYNTDGPPVALIGKVKVRIVGPINKGESIVSSSIPGCARAVNQLNKSERIYSFGKALETNLSNSEKLVECIIK